MTRPVVTVSGMVADERHNGITGVVKEKFFVPSVSMACCCISWRAARMRSGSASRLYQVRPSDPLTFAVVATALVASALPAYRATRVSPLVALRTE